MKLVCPLCNAPMHEKGIGTACPNCGYVHVNSPIAGKFYDKSYKKTIIICVCVLLIGWIIPAIILMLVK